MASKPKQNSNILIIVISILFLVSIGMSIVGLLNGKGENNSKGSSELKEAFEEEKKESEEESLTELFQKEFAETTDSRWGYPNDPFREICAPAGDGSAPAISSHTVCYR